MRTSQLIAVFTALTLAACGSGSGSGADPAVQNTGTKAKPPATDYDAEIIFCSGGSTAAEQCHGKGKASDDQIAAVASKLRADSNTTAVFYLSGDDVNKVGDQLLTAKERSELPSNPSPSPRLLLTFAGQGSENDSFIDTYNDLPGVEQASLCVGDVYCRVSALRDAKVLG